MVTVVTQVERLLVLLVGRALRAGRQGQVRAWASEVVVVVVVSVVSVSVVVVVVVVVLLLKGGKGLVVVVVVVEVVVVVVVVDVVLVLLPVEVEVVVVPVSMVVWLLQKKTMAAGLGWLNQRDCTCLRRLCVARGRKEASSR